ncbi:MAG: hypothetical protein LBL94_00620 [Prevotellaceae bacterium]|nr:hypothetical protein [Prevotellaceae bacterium]
MSDSCGLTDIVAYQLVHAIREELKKKNIRHGWRHIHNIMSSTFGSYIKY